ncbi:hypothetical protein RhiirB3_398978 [Rhizophagus irregularis]|nr:hypothetical protein RhiirB3_398978 [Rhizophagus irregularis]
MPAHWSDAGHSVFLTLGNLPNQVRNLPEAKMKKDELKLQSDHTVLKIELKDMMDDLRCRIRESKLQNHYI